MKNIFKTWALCILAAFFISGCDLDIAPSDSMTGAQMAESPDGLESVVNGCYAIMKDEQPEYSQNSWYLRQFYQMPDFSSDDVTYGWGTTDNLHMIFVYDQRDPGLDNITAFWAQNYKLIYSANVCINIASQKEDGDETRHIKAEAMFLKAFAMHNLVRLYAKQYNEETKSSPGIIIRENDIDAAPKARASVEETYAYIVDLLLKAEELFKSSSSSRAENKGFASLGACRALLSRVYLYMRDWDNCIKYSEEVIKGGQYQMTQAADYPDYFKDAAKQGETIWCIVMLESDDKQSASVAGMIMTAGDGCWGEEGYSSSVLSDMGYNDAKLKVADTRNHFVEPVNVNSSGLSLYPCSKFSWQGGRKTLSSPVMFRLSEMYLNSAEAYAHKNESDKVLEMLNEVRRHRFNPDLVPGASIDDFLYTASNHSGLSDMDIALKERRLEFVFEGFRFYDLLRHGKDIVRNYWGYQIPSFEPGQSTATPPGLDTPGVVTKASYERLVFPIPSREIGNNSLCVQNKGY